MKIGLVIPAAGASKRYADGADYPRSKLDEDLGGKSVLQRSIELFTKDDRVGFIIVAGPHEPAAFAEFKARHGDKLGFLGAALCPGGKTHRHETVAAALAHVPDDCTHIAVHDAARPCTPVELIERVFDAAERHPAVIPAVEVGDTLKRVRETDGPGDADPLAAILGTAGTSRTLRTVETTIDRRGAYAVQTPQVFEAGLLRRAYAQPDLSSTDDAGLVERLGEPVVVVDGDARNIKITRPGDLHLARLILNIREERREAHKRF